MRRLSSLILVATVLLAALGPALLVGCGEKIAIPQPIGLFGAHAYFREAVYTEPTAVQVSVVNNNLFVLQSDGKLYKRNLAYGAIDSLVGLSQPTAFCRGDQSQLIFVWEQGAGQGQGQVRVVSSTNLAPLGATPLPAVRSVTGMVACSTGVHIVAGARTFLYLSDPDSGVVHRYDYSLDGTFRPFGLLARRGGEGARFVKRPAGLAVDRDGMLLVCDADTSRNWVIRFDPTPDLSDETPQPGDEGPWRGLAVLFDAATCNPPAPTDYVLGNAAVCGQTDWVGRPSNEPGEFHSPLDVAIDGRGHIYVADTGNNRIQLFTPTGMYEMRFGTAADLPGPSSHGLVDWRYGSAADAINYGAYLFVLTPGTGQIIKFISYEQYQDINNEPPPG